MQQTAKFRVRHLIATSVLLMAWTVSAAQQTELNSIHWAYSSYFGTGWYQVSDIRDVYVFRVTPRWEVRETSFDDGERSVGVEFRFPVTVGLDTFNLEDPTGIIDPNNLASVSFTPGIDVTVPVTRNWSLRPFTAVGWGTILGEADSAWTYWAGIKSKFAFRHGKLDWALLNSVGYVGYSPSDGPSEDFWPIMAGLEFEYPMGEMKLGGDPLFLAWHGTYTAYEEDLDPVLADGSIDPITDQWEFGLAFGKRDERIRIWKLSFDRLGLAYRFSSSGDLQGITVVFRSIFDR